MGDIVNLGRARKERARADKAVQAAANRVAFGRTKAEKATQREDATRRDRTLDGAKREE